MHIVANDSEFDIDGNTTLLQALRQHGIAADFSCRNGNCGLCEASLNAGRVWLNDKAQFVDAPSTLLLCRAFACVDLKLTVSVKSRAVSRYCRVLGIEQIVGGYQLTLRLPAGRIPDLLPGDAVCLEGSVGARLIVPVAVSAEGTQRTLTLSLIHI